jgi:hypothetical protein
MKKQTAVEWLALKFSESSEDELAENINIWFGQAIAMERDQIIEAYRDGRTDQQTRVPKFYNRSSAIYYTSTYGS